MRVTGSGGCTRERQAQGGSKCATRCADRPPVNAEPLPRRPRNAATAAVCLQATGLQQVQASINIRRALPPAAVGQARAGASLTRGAARSGRSCIWMDRRSSSAAELARAANRGGPVRRQHARPIAILPGRGPPSTTRPFLPLQAGLLVHQAQQQHPTASASASPSQGFGGRQGGALQQCQQIMEGAANASQAPVSRPLRRRRRPPVGPEPGPGRPPGPPRPCWQCCAAN